MKPTNTQIKQYNRKRDALAGALNGRAEASSASLARSYGLPIEDVKILLRSKGVRDND